MGTQEKQKEMKTLLKKMGWSLRALAEAVIHYENDLDITLPDSGDPNKRYEKIKGHFKRASTSEDIFDHYLKTIMEHIDYESLKLNHIRPNFIPHECLDKDFQAELIKISDKVFKVK